MTRARALFALALVLVACGAPVPAAVPARVEVAAQTSTAVVIGVVIREGTTDAIVCLPNVADCPVLQTSPGITPTPVPQTASPTIPLTNTPRATEAATHTVVPANSPLPQITPDDTLTPFATPTPQATSTPGNATPAPDGKVCELVVGIIGGINVRAAASTTSTIKSKAPQGTRVTVEAFQKAGGYLWATVANGFMVVGQYIDPFAWWVSFNSNEFCDTKPGWDFNVPAPPEVATVVKVPIFAFHAVPGANVNEMIEAGRVLLAADIPFRR